MSQRTFESTLGLLATFSLSGVACDGALGPLNWTSGLPVEQPDACAAVIPPSTPGAQRCNGAAALCARPFDRVAFAATHNSYANLEEGFKSEVANQYSSVRAQLDRGIRLINIDVHHGLGNELAACHTDPEKVGAAGCLFGEALLTSVLAEVRGWMCAHPDEVLTLTFESHVRWPEIAAALEATGLSSRVLDHAPGTPWPTLGEMIASGRRVVVFVEDAGGSRDVPPAHAWDQIALATVAGGPSWAATDLEEIAASSSCREDADRPFFLLEHLANGHRDPGWLGGGDPFLADALNRFETLAPRVLGCQAQRREARGDAALQPAINFVAVDFFETHAEDQLRTVDILNQVDTVDHGASPLPDSPAEGCPELDVATGHRDRVTCASARHYACVDDADWWQITRAAGPWSEGQDRCRELGATFQAPLHGFEHSLIRALAFVDSPDGVWLAGG